MKKIDKTDPPKSFVDFVKKKKPVHWCDCDSLIKSEAKEFMLLNEQDLLCGYTEIYIDNDDNHIDHYVKRSIDNGLCYDWNNLIVSVNDDDFGAKYKDNGENGVKVKSDYLKLLNPVKENCEVFFKYSFDGKIDALDDLNKNDKEKAIRTIEAFNLNHESLKSRRKEIPNLIQCFIEGGESVVDIPKYLDNYGFTTCVNYFITNFFNN